MSQPRSYLDDPEVLRKEVAKALMGKAESMSVAKDGTLTIKLTGGSPLPRRDLQALNRRARDDDARS